MKKVIFFLLSVFLLTSCQKDEPKIFKLDPEAKISIKPDVNSFKSGALKIKSSVTHLTALEIVQKTTVMRFRNDAIFGDSDAMRGFSESQRDFNPENPCLKMWATDIISVDGEYVPEFIEGKDCVLEAWSSFGNTRVKDTIAYIPNSVLRKAEADIKAAYAAQNIELIYQIFNEAFTFRPISGEEYRELKLLSQN